MLQGDFYTISSMTVEGNSLNAALAINAGHAIFEGHFPGQPVVPGVCMMQMVKELVESALATPTRLVKADHLKFLSVIDPRQHPAIDAAVSYTIDEAGAINITGSLTKDEITFLKIRARLEAE
ncbi:MAG: 3-hydroxyacyl-ACP dehydratase [Chitinophagaceae bacterium]